MGLVKRGGKFLKKDGKLVTTENCCCNCIEYCSDTEISVTLPAPFEAGPWVLDRYTPIDPAPVAGCCYWRNIVGGGDIESIYVTACITGDHPDKVATLTLTVTTINS